MSVLYRKYRPSKFAEIMGQDLTVQVLLNQISSGNFGHAYLFSGPRGTGKTSVARIMAKALNCLKIKKGEPCGQCAICRSVEEGTFLDLVEIDAASNRGIDDVRALRDQVNFQTVEGRFKVYVLDEVHMLTKEAFNALLKTLEEPPAHVIFILCTTEVHRLPDTVISRCQKFDFLLAKQETVVRLLSSVCEKEGIEFEEGALALIAEQSGGSFRDALGLLEKTISFSNNGRLSISVVESSLSLVSRELIKLVWDNLRQGEILLALEKLNQLINSGTDSEIFRQQFSLFLRDQLKFCLQEEEDISEIVQMMRLLQEASRDSRYAVISQLPLELALVRFKPLSRSKTEFSEIKAVSPEKKEFLIKDSSQQDSVEIQEKGEFEDLELVTGKWLEVMQSVKPHNHSLYALLKGCEPESLLGNTISLVFPYKFHKERVEQDENRRLVEEVCSDIFGLSVKVKCCWRQIKNKEVLSSSSVSEDISLDESLSEDDLILMAQDILGGEVLDV